MYKTFPCTLPVPGAGLTFSTPVTELAAAAGDEAASGFVEDDRFVDPLAVCEFSLPPLQLDKVIAARTQMHTSDQSRNFIA